MTTNISACMLVRNEADQLTDCLETVEPIVDELVIVDGNSDDGTVALAEAFCDEYSLDLQVIESTQREYLLEGPGTQRRRAEEAASNEYTLALGADVRIDVQDEEWFHRPFKHVAYTHTRKKPGGFVDKDFRLCSPEKVEDLFIDKTFDDEESDGPPRWRGLVHEELRTKLGRHISDVFPIPDCPMIHRQERHGAMDSHSVYDYHQHRHHPDVGGNMGDALKKQHYLLKRAILSHQSRYLSDAYKHYFEQNKKTVQEDWWKIKEEYDLPILTRDERHWVEDNTAIDGFDLTDMDPVMDHRNNNVVTYLKKKVTGEWRRNETE